LCDQNNCLYCPNYFLGFVHYLPPTRCTRNDKLWVILEDHGETIAYIVFLSRAVVLNLG